MKTLCRLALLLICLSSPLYAADQQEIQRYAEAVNTSLGNKFVNSYYTMVQQGWQPQEAYNRLWSTATQEHLSYMAAKPCPVCATLYGALINKGWKPVIAFYGLWAYSNGWNMGYRHGQWTGYYRDQLPANYKTQFENEYQTDFALHQGSYAWWTGSVLGMYQLGYMDGKQQGRLENWGNGKPLRYPEYNDFLSFFRASGIDVCAPMGDLPLNRNFWRPFGGTLCLTR